MFKDKLKLAKITEDQFNYWRTQMADADFYERLHRQNVIVIPHEQNSQHNLLKKLHKSFEQFKMNYLQIQDANWPMINNFDDFNNLPTEIISECIMKGLSFNRWKKNIQNINAYQFDDQRYLSLFPVIKIVMENAKYFENQHVVEFHAGRGKLSASILHLGCESLICIGDDNDACQRNLDRYFSKTVTYYDIDNYKSLSYNHIDTVLITALMREWNNMQHEYDTQDILDSIMPYQPQRIIIEYDRMVNGQVFLDNDVVLNGYTCVNTHDWIFHLDKHKVHKELNIYELTK